MSTQHPLAVGPSARHTWAMATTGSQPPAIKSLNAQPPPPPHCCPLCAAYYRGAMGILLVYDVTDEGSFNNIRNWMRNIEQHASDNVNKVCECGGWCACYSRRIAPSLSSPHAPSQARI